MNRSSVLVAAALVLTACGGGSDDPPAAATTQPTGTDVVQTTAPTTTTPEAATETTPTATTPTTAAPATVPEATAPPTTDTIEVEDAEPWLVELAEPSGLRLVGWVSDAPAAPEPVGAAADVEGQLTEVYGALIELWRSDPRMAAVGMSDNAFEREHLAVAPGAMVEVLGAAAAVLRDSFLTIEAHADRFVADGSPQSAMFAAWSDFAGQWAKLGDEVRASLAAALELAPEDQQCFLERLNGDDGCDGPGDDLATRLDTEMTPEAEALDDIDIDEPVTYSLAGPEFDECSAWDGAVVATGLAPEEELQIWVALDDSDLDRNFVSLSECGWTDRREEDPVIDTDGDEAILLGYLTAIAEAIVASGYDETIYDFGGGAEDERRYWETTSALATARITNAARDEASVRWPSVATPDLALKLYVVAAISFEDWLELGDQDVGWDDLGGGMCEAWQVAVADYGDDERRAIDAATDELSLFGTLIPDRC